MIVLPIVGRELRVRSRRAGTHWVRAGVAVAALLLCLQMFQMFSGQGDPAEAGRAVFLGLAWLAQLLAAAAVLLTADAVGSERREGTLGLMFLTDLKGYDVALGKLAAAGLNAVYGLMAFVPTLALTLVAGGVTGGEVARYALVTLHTLLVALALGLAVSTRRREQFKAMTTASLLMGGLLVAPMLTVLLPIGFRLLSILSPQQAFRLASASEYPGAVTDFWLSLAVLQAEAWLLVGLASRALSRFRRLDLAERKPRKAANSKPPARRRVGPRADQHPVAWLAAQLPGQQAIAWWAAALILLPKLLPGVLFRLFGMSNTGFGLYYTGALFAAFGSAALFAAAASRFLFAARHTGHLESLAATPLGMQGVIEGTWLALLRVIRWPLLVLVGWHVLELLTTLLADPHAFPKSLRTVHVVVTAINQALTILALCWVGMRFGLRSRWPLSAVAWTAGLVMGVPWIMHSLGWAAIQTLIPDAFVLGGNRLPSLKFVVAWLFLPSVHCALNLFFIHWARHPGLEVPHRPLRQTSRILLDAVASLFKSARRWQAD